MTTELAELIRTLRRDHSLSYHDLGYDLCESALDAGAYIGLGKVLTDLAALHLDDQDREWI